MNINAYIFENNILAFLIFIKEKKIKSDLTLK